MTKKQDLKLKKQPYFQPKLRIIDLVAEEVLAVGCKTTGASAPLNPTSCMAASCSQDGS